jgi:GPH family glycoside/pentoside/hexuronide:cation symporter
MPDNDLSSSAKFLFGLGNFGSSAAGALSAQLQLYFTKYLGYPATAVANARAFSTFIDAFADPVMGYLSDSTTSRLGRRMPYILVGSFILAGAFLAMWFVPAGLPAWQFWTYLFAMQVLFTIGTSITGVPYFALIPEIAKEYSTRTALVAWMQALAQLGNIVGGGVRAYSTWRGNELQGFREFAVYISILDVVCYILLVLFVREPPIPERVLAQIRDKKLAGGSFFEQHVLGLFRSLSTALADRQFLILFAAIFISQAGILAGLWMYTFLLDDWFGKTWDTPFALAYVPALFRDAFFLWIFVAIGCGVLFLPFWNWLGKMVDKQKCLMAGIAGVGLTYGLSYFLFAPKSYPLLLLYCIITAFFYASVNIFPTSMIADIATHSALVHGEENDGMFYGAYSFLQKIYNTVSWMWTGFALEYIVGYQGGEGAVQSAETLWRMRVLYAAPACLTAIFALLVLARYDLSRAKMEEVREELKQRRLSDS